jgi:hypothetical protein
VRLRSRLDTLPALPSDILERGPTSDRVRKTERRAMLALTAAFIFQPILHPGGPFNSSPVDLLLIASVVLFAIWAWREPRRIYAPYLLPVGIMVAAGAASGITSQFPRAAIQALLVDLLLFAWCTTVTNVLSQPRTFRYVLTAWALSGIVWASIVVVAWLGHVSVVEGLNAADGNRVLFTFGDPNYASTYWLTTLFVIYAMQRPTNRWFRLAGYAVVFWALVLTESNGGFLSLAIGIAFVVLMKIYRQKGWAGLGAAMLVLGLGVASFLVVLPLNTLREKALYSNQPILVNSIGRSAQSSSERSQLISEMGQLYNQTNGLLGIGPDATKPTLTAELAVYPNEAHDDYLAALVERGPFGLLGLLLLVGSAVRWAGPLVKNRVSRRFAEVIPIPLGLAAGLLALGVNSFYEEILHFRFLWSLLAIVAVVGRDSKQAAVGAHRQHPA